MRAHADPRVFGCELLRRKLKLVDSFGVVAIARDTGRVHVLGSLFQVWPRCFFSVCG